jgi:hypothetical protein
LISPVDTYTTNTGYIQLRRWTSTDVWVWLSGYIRQLSTDNFASVYFSWFTSSTWVNITWLSDNTYYRRIYSIDNLWQTWLSSTWTFNIDSVAPIASVIYSITWNTNQDVIAILTWYSKTLTWINATWYTFTWNGTFTFTFSDLAWNTWSTQATVTWIDKVKPIASVIYSITWRTNQNVIVVLTWYSETLTWINATWYTFTSNGNFTFTFGDLYGNTWSTTAIVNNIDKTFPILNTWYISSWLTWYNWWNLYYKWIVNLRSFVSDVWWSILSWNTCQYNTWNNRASAIYSWAGWYCEVTWLDYQSDFFINFRILDTAGNTWVSNTWTYIYDNISPTWLAFTINNNSTWTNQTWVILNITCPTDAWIEWIEIAYGNTSSQTNRTWCTSTKSRILSTWDWEKTVYMRTRDTFVNTTSDTTDTIIYDISWPSVPDLVSPYDW